MRAASPEVIAVPGYYTDIANIARQARAAGMPQPLLGGDGWESIQEMGGAAVEGAYYSNHYSSDDQRAEVKRFVDLHRSRFHRTPDSLSALAYDATMLVKDALERKVARGAHLETMTLAEARSTLRDALAATHGFQGVTGAITMDEQRNAEKPAFILQIHGTSALSVDTIGPWSPAVAAAAAAHDQAAGQGEGQAQDETSQARAGGRGLVELLWKGVAVGSLYALLALGYTMVYGILAFINFAHSDVFMLGAFLSFTLMRAFGLADVDARHALEVMVIVMAACALAGFLIERLAYRPLRHAPRLNVLITAIGVSLFIENSGQLVFGKSVVQLPPVADHTFVLAGVQIRGVELVAVATSLVLMVLLQALVYGTKVGRGMRAVSVDHQVAGLMGIPVDRIISLTFIIGSALAGAGGLLVGLTYGQLKQPADASWILYGLKAFVAAVIGGIGNLPGAMLGGLLLGLAEQLVAGFVSTTFRDAIAFALLIVILLVRPSGLLGRRVVEKV